MASRNTIERLLSCECCNAVCVSLRVTQSSLLCGLNLEKQDAVGVAKPKDCLSIIRIGPAWSEEHALLFDLFLLQYSVNQLCISSF
ncbi:hypothetical protein SOVF_137290 isoform A [Spinacia oleracea]|nr:hypothetical protein SOVF_137290 isoform A [Spinacia oleracea]